MMMTTMLIIMVMIMMAVTITMMLMMIMAITIMMMLMMMLTREPVAFFCYFSSFELMTRGKKVRADD